MQLAALLIVACFLMCKLPLIIMVMKYGQTLLFYITCLSMPKKDEKDEEFVMEGEEDKEEDKEVDIAVIVGNVSECFGLLLYAVCVIIYIQTFIP